MRLEKPDRQAEEEERSSATRWHAIPGEQGIVQRFETQFQRKDGSICWVSINARAVKDEAGTVLYYEGTMEDFTESKREIEELRRMVEKSGKATSGS